MLDLNLLCLLATFLFPGALEAAESGPRDIVDVGYAKYLGNRAYPNTVAYLGIPYAEPPLGERRWRKPLPLNTTRIALESGGGIIDATSYPNFCVQGATSATDTGGAGTEDCLNVNIYTPASVKPTGNLPVLVYIHGGAYVYGNPRNWPFEHWIHQSPNVVIVSVYYRLDSLGFLSTPAFRDPANGDFNVGFEDQIQALRWVRENIARFGGDPEKVTINGESAGGSSVELHLVAAHRMREVDSERPTPLFSGAIAQSVYRTPLPTPEQQQALFDFYVKRVGCAGGSIRNQLACLRAAPVGSLAIAQDAAKTSAFEGPYRAFHPVLDGRVFREYPTEAILAGRFASVPLIVGATSNETLSGGTTIAAALQEFFPSMLDQDVEDLLAVYPESDYASEGQRFMAVTGESELICARSLMGGAFTQREKVWTYRYNQPMFPTTDIVWHAAENFIFFQGTATGSNGTTTFIPLNSTESAFAEELIAYWLSFVRTKSPNTYKLPRSPIWKEYTLDDRARIVLQAINDTTRSGNFLEVETVEETKRCSVVASKVRKQQN